jgi:hypothetical protein
MLSCGEMIRMTMMCPASSYSYRHSECGFLFSDYPAIPAESQLFSDHGGIGCYSGGHELYVALDDIHAAVHLYHAAGGSLH